MSTVTGNFYFKRTSAGNLIGEYSNSEIERSRPESALLREATGGEGQGSEFPGEYISTWFEPGMRGEKEECVAAKLEIKSKNGTPSNLFTLVWNSLEGKPMFKGEAMLSDGMLIGSYWSA